MMADIEKLAAQSESETLEFKLSAGELREEAELFCRRHFPLPGRIEPGRLQRVDRPLIPPDAMREILVNALTHRDYSIAGGAVSLAIFDERVEVWSAGRFPSGITPESLTRAHPSVQRNPIIAEVFHRAGLIEKWGRGANRAAEMCRATGIAPPEFAEISGAAVVVFRVDVLGSSGAYSQVAPQVTLHVSPQVAAILKAATTPSSVVELQRAAGLKDRVHFLREYLQPLLEKGWIERTIPDKPRSRNQRYRTTEPGRQVAYGPGSKKDDEP